MVVLDINNLITIGLSAGIIRAAVGYSKARVTGQAKFSIFKFSYTVVLALVLTAVMGMFQTLPPLLIELFVVIGITVIVGEIMKTLFKGGMGKKPAE